METIEVPPRANVPRTYSPGVITHVPSDMDTKPTAPPAAPPPGATYAPVTVPELARLSVERLNVYTRSESDQLTVVGALRAPRFEIWNRRSPRVTVNGRPIETRWTPKIWWLVPSGATSRCSGKELSQYWIPASAAVIV